MSKHLIAALLAVAAAAVPARAEPRLTTTVHTASPGGFLVTSTLVAGDKEAVLIDAQFSLAEAHRLIATVLESKKTLTAVYITHAHPDHYFGLAAIRAAFPKARLLAHPAAVAELTRTWPDKVKQWRPLFGDVIPEAAVVPAALADKTLTVDGVPLELRLGQGDSADGSYVWIPSTRTVIAGDIVYSNVHVWTKETDAAQRKAWIRTLDQIAALNPAVVIAGHKDPKAKDDLAAVKATRAYLEAWDAALATAKTSAELQQAMKAKFPTYQLDIILQLAADQARPAAAKR